MLGPTRFFEDTHGTRPPPNEFSDRDFLSVDFDPPAEEALMADILQFRPRLDVFVPELTSAMGDAYDKAIAALSNNDSELAVRELVAKRIVRLAKRGERDPEHLCSLALSGFRKPHTAA
jgi:hypothetical protein